MFRAEGIKTSLSSCLLERLAEETDAWIWEAEIHGLIGETRLAGDPGTNAQGEACFSVLPRYDQARCNPPVAQA